MLITDPQATASTGNQSGARAKEIHNFINGEHESAQHLRADKGDPLADQRSGGLAKTVLMQRRARVGLTL